MLQLIISFIKQYEAVFGIILGGIITIVIQNSTNRIQSKMRITEIVINKRITAYEAFYNKIKEMRFMKPLSWKEENEPEELLERTPYILENTTVLDKYITDISLIFQSNYQWYNIDLVREYNFTQDYFINMRRIFYKIDPERYNEFGNLIRQDIVEICSVFDKIIMKYFANDLYNQRYRPILKKWHKYEKRKTMNRLENMRIQKEYQKITYLFMKEKET